MYPKTFNDYKENPVKKHAVKKTQKTQKTQKTKRTLDRKLGGGTVYGYRENSRPALLLASLQEKPLTMKEVVDLPWNTFHVTHYCVAKELLAKKLIRLDNNKRMHAVKSAKKSAKEA